MLTLIIFHVNLFITFGYLFDTGEHFGLRVDTGENSSRNIEYSKDNECSVWPLVCDIACHGSHCGQGEI